VRVFSLLVVLGKTEAKNSLKEKPRKKTVVLFFSFSFFTLKNWNQPSQAKELVPVCFSFSSLFWISFREIQKLDDPKSKKLEVPLHELLVLGAIQLLDLLKANKKMTKS
jgi:hypothetical protein